MVRQIGLPVSSLKGDLDTLYVDQLLRWIQTSTLDALVILAQELVYDEHGTFRKSWGLLMCPMITC